MSLARIIYQILLKVENMNENMSQMFGRSATISWFSQSRHLWLSYVVRLVEGTITSVCECLEILYTSHYMDKR